jgi:MFS family permease
LRPQRYSWVILSTGFTVMFLAGGSRFAFGLVLKPMTEELGWSRSTLSLAATVFMTAAAVGLPVAGRLVDRYSLKWTMVGGAALVALGIGLMAFVRSPWHVFVVYGLIL